VRHVRLLLERLSYANVVATIALCVSLGGVSYAAITLPAHSVGPRELRSEAVTRSALGFPLGVEGITDRSFEDLVKTPCNSPLGPCRRVISRPRPARCPRVFTPAGPIHLSSHRRELHLRLGTAGRIVVSAIAGLRDEGPPNTTAYVSVSLVVDGCTAVSGATVVHGGETTQAPVQLFARAAPGLHTIRVELAATYSSSEPGDVWVSPVSLIASTLPAA